MAVFLILAAAIDVHRILTIDQGAHRSFLKPLAIERDTRGDTHVFINQSTIIDEPDCMGNKSRLRGSLLYMRHGRMWTQPEVVIDDRGIGDAILLVNRKRLDAVVTVCKPCVASQPRLDPQQCDIAHITRGARGWRTPRFLLKTKVFSIVGLDAEKDRRGALTIAWSPAVLYSPEEMRIHSMRFPTGLDGETVLACLPGYDITNPHLVSGRIFAQADIHGETPRVDLIEWVDGRWRPIAIDIVNQMTQTRGSRSASLLIEYADRPDGSLVDFDVINTAAAAIADTIRIPTQETNSPDPVGGRRRDGSVFIAAMDHKNLHLFRNNGGRTETVKILDGPWIDAFQMLVYDEHAEIIVETHDWNHAYLDAVNVQLDQLTWIPISAE